jgi:hypothetical protein
LVIGCLTLAVDLGVDDLHPIVREDEVDAEIVGRPCARSARKVTQLDVRAVACDQVSR